MIKWLSEFQVPDVINNGDICYDLGKIKKSFEVVEIVQEQAWLILKKSSDPDDTWMHWAVMGFYSSDGDGSDITVEVVFHGEGPTEILRECRHTWWGEDGYIFYPKTKIITAALAELSKYYDMD